MSDRVSEIARLNNLANAASLLENDQENDQRPGVYKDAAVRCGMGVLALAVQDEGQQEALDDALETLRKQNYETHKTVKETLRQSRVAIVLYENRRRRAA